MANRVFSLRISNTFRFHANLAPSKLSGKNGKGSRNDEVNPTNIMSPSLNSS